MSALLALVIIGAWGTWIPVAQVVPGVAQQARVFYATLGNLVVAVAALLIGGGQVSLGWKGFWLPLVGGLVWVGGNYTAFRATAIIGLARANGAWAPINIIVSFVWGALLFGELGHTSVVRLAVLSVSLVLVIAGVLMIVRSQEGPADASPALSPQVLPVPASTRDVSGAVLAEPAGLGIGTVGGAPAADGDRPGGTFRTGFLMAGAAGVLWGSYFIPSQWAGVAAQVGNFPLAVGMVLGGAVLAASGRVKLQLGLRPTGAQLTAGCLFGVGNVALLSLVSRVGTGVGFTLAQLALVVNAGIGIYVFKVPLPGSRAARRAIVGILIAGAGGLAIGAFK